MHPSNRKMNTPPTFKFGKGDNYRPQARSRDSYRPPSETKRRTPKRDFTFRPDGDAPRYPAGGKSPESRRPDRRPREQRNNNRRGRGGFFRQKSMNDRPLLRSKREVTPENMLELGDGVARFKDVGDLSESDTDMDIEDDSASGSENGEASQPAKKSRIENKASADGDSLPRWSNPDPYAVLPPVDESEMKRKDVVKLIRKAKVDVLKDAAANGITENDDFISFNVDDGVDQSGDSEVSSGEDSIQGRGSRNQEQFSHLRNLHGDLNKWEPFTDDGKINNEADMWPSLDWRERDRRSKIDEVGVPQSSRKRKRDDQLDGSILPEWLARSRESAAPWYTLDHSRSQSMGIWLHKEICDFYDFVRPKHFETRLREDLILRLESCMSKRHPGITVESFGSFASGLYLPTADMDLVIISDEYRRGGYPRLGTSRSFMHKFAKHLGYEGLTKPDSVEVIWNAKVPIIKYVDRLTGLKVDLSFENLTGVVAVDTFGRWNRDFPAMAPLVVLIKHFLLIRGLNEVYTGGLGGFTVTCLVVSLLQHLPQVQSGNMRQEHNLGELLMDFLDLYGNKFNIANTGISLDPPGYFPKREFSAGLTVLDPNAPTNDISKGSRNVERIFHSFSCGYDLLRDRISDLCQKSFADRQLSVLGCIIGADYSSFERQRDLLRKQYEQRR